MSKDQADPLDIMSHSLTFEDILAHRHPLMPNPDDFRVVRYEADVDPDEQIVTSLVLTLRSVSDEVRLRFVNPQLEQFGPLQIPISLLAGPIYVVDMNFQGWENHAKVMVGSMAEDKPTFFYAREVEIVS